MSAGWRIPPVAGVLMVTGTYTTLNAYLIRITPDWLISCL